MIFWISAFIFAIVISYLIYIHHHPYHNSDILWTIAISYFLLWLVIHTVFGISALDTYFIKQERLQIQYEELEKNKNNEYIRPEIIAWNRDLRFYQKYEKDFWIGIYIPNIFDQYKTIEVDI